MFIEVTSKSGELVLLNASDIVRVDPNGKSSTMITTTNGDSFFIDTNYDDMKQKLLQA